LIGIELNKLKEPKTLDQSHLKQIDWNVSIDSSPQTDPQQRALSSFTTSAQQT